MAETITCSHCGTKHSFDSRFCSGCGASLLPATGMTTRLEGNVCPACHTTIPERVQFCPACGQRVGDAPASHAQPSPRTSAWDRPAGRSMLCPGCRDVPLQMAERQGIEVEYCPTCRGVWLDRGELDKIIERVALTQGGPPPSPTQRHDRGAPTYRQHDHDDDDYRRKKKRRGILDELFDFD